MRLDRLKAFALARPQTTVVRQWGECLVFKVAGRMFLLLALDGEVIDGVIVKCTPEEFDALTAIDGIAQAPYCAKRMWVRIEGEALPEAGLRRCIRRSHDLVVARLPKRIQSGLAAGTKP
ncbi:MAG: MmcQ/YjbR family DNA-binding protein [Opitutae bacterium]|nr:MmcQ/YjbR family DNA-binding protein [Opitutae bacterium]